MAFQVWVLGLLLLWVHPARPAITGPIKTVVVLVMENRSFDHMLGYLNRRNPSIDGLSGAEFNVIDERTLFVSDTAEFVDPDPGHSFQAIREQVFGPDLKFQDPPPMSGFATNAERIRPGMSTNVMRAFRPEVVPVTTALAMEYTVFDRWCIPIPDSDRSSNIVLRNVTLIVVLIAGLRLCRPRRSQTDCLFTRGRRMA